MAKYLDPAKVRKYGRCITGDHELRKGGEEIAVTLYNNGVFDVVPYDDPDYVENQYRAGMFITKQLYAFPLSQVASSLQVG